MLYNAKDLGMGFEYIIPNLIGNNLQTNKYWRIN